MVRELLRLMGSLLQATFSDVVSSSFWFYSIFISFNLLLGQPLRREGAFLEEVDLPPGDPRAGLKFSERLELDRQRARHITPATSWQGFPWSPSDSAPASPSRIPSPPTDDSDSPTSTTPQRRGKSSSFCFLFFLF